MKPKVKRPEPPPMKTTLERPPAGGPETKVIHDL